MNGTVEFRNEFGYLNAEFYPLLKFYLLALIIYGLMGFIWGSMLKKYNDYLIIVHHFVTVMIVLGFIEAVFMYFEYRWYNKEGRRNIVFIIVNVILLSLRTVLGLAIVLLISLGYGTVTNDVSKYKNKIAMLSYVQFFTNCVYWGVIYWNH